MNIVTVEKFSLAGIASRTTNAAEMSGTGIIPALWQRFTTEFSPSGAIYAVYSNYESDQHGAYDYFIGAKATDGPKEVHAGKYRVFTSERGPVWEVVPRIWQRIWSEAENRAFQTDFELYDTRAANPADAQVDVYVGLK